MKNTKPLELGIAFCLAISLLASAVSACTCLHHQPVKAADEHSCHNETAETAESDNSSDQTHELSGAGCSCFEIVPKLPAKSESPKLKKHAATNSTESPLLFTVVSNVVVSLHTFAKPLYLSDSFYNISPPRGPPRA